MIGSFLRRVAGSFGYSLGMEYPAFLRQPRARLDLDPCWVLAHLACCQQQVTFIQIGANDGKRNDPIRRYVLANKWKGLLIEPDPELFEKLCLNYADQADLKFLNAAVGTGEAMDFYSVDAAAPGAPTWANGLGSFRKEVILSHAKAWPEIGQHLRTRKIGTIAPNEMFEQLGEARVDLLIMDVEGYEWEIIRQIDFKRHDVGCIYYESKHLPRNKHSEVIDYLVESGYAVGVGGIDTVAVKKQR